MTIACLIPTSHCTCTGRSNWCKWKHGHDYWETFQWPYLHRWSLYHRAMHWRKRKYFIKPLDFHIMGTSVYGLPFSYAPRSPNAALSSPNIHTKHPCRMVMYWGLNRRGIVHIECVCGYPYSLSKKSVRSTLDTITMALSKHQSRFGRSLVREGWGNRQFSKYIFRVTARIRWWSFLTVMIYVGPQLMMKCKAVQTQMEEVSRSHKILTGEECSLVAVKDAFQKISTRQEMWSCYEMTCSTLTVWRQTRCVEVGFFTFISLFVLVMFL